jgi:ABC-type sugar transport system ATPase subunit
MRKDMEKELGSIVCLCGNDGTGKSTLVKLITQLHPELHVI